MCNGKGKSRKKSRNAEARAQDFANQGIERFNPFVEQGQQASNQLAAFAGLGSASDQAAAKNAFTDSLFYQGGQNAFGLEKDAIDSALSAQGLNFSSARLNAVEDARQRNFQNAFSQFLNNTSGIANAGFGAVQAQAGLNRQQGANALEAGHFRAGSHGGVLGALKDISSIGANVGQAYGGFN